MSALPRGQIARPGYFYLRDIQLNAGREYSNVNIIPICLHQPIKAHLASDVRIQAIGY